MSNSLRTHTGGSALLLANKASGLYLKKAIASMSETRHHFKRQAFGHQKNRLLVKGCLSHTWIQWGGNRKNRHQAAADQLNLVNLV